MTPSIAEFEAKGWFLSQEGIDLIAAENDGVSTLEDYIACAKDVSLSILQPTQQAPLITNTTHALLDGSSTLDYKRIQQNCRET